MKARIVNLIVWLVLAIGLMFVTYKAWSAEGDYGWLQFVASFVFDFGFCGVLGFWCDDFIKRNRKTEEFDFTQFNVKTFEDLTFYPILNEEDNGDKFLEEFYEGCQQARMTFDNGYGISVIIGKIFYSNGVNTYEVGTLHNDELFVLEPFEDTVIGYRTEQEVTEIMRKLQRIKD